MQKILFGFEDSRNFANLKTSSTQIFPYFEEKLRKSEEKSRIYEEKGKIRMFWEQHNNKILIYFYISWKKFAQKFKLFENVLKLGYSPLIFEIIIEHLSDSRRRSQPTLSNGPSAFLTLTNLLKIEQIALLTSIF